MRSLVAFLLLAVISDIGLAQASTCYYANGTALAEPSDFQPCNISPVKTICCALNRTNNAGGDLADGFTKDECLPNGLCQNRAVDNGTEKTTWWLDLCANKDITSSDCLDVCRDDRGDGGNTRLTPCGDDPRNTTRWCCGDSTTCCTNNVNVVELPLEFVGHVISSSASSSAATATATTSASSSPFSSSQGASSGLSTGAKAGIGVGVAVGSLALLAAAFFARKAYKYKKQASGPKIGNMDPSSPAPYSEAYAPFPASGAPPEKYKSSEYAPSELPPAATAPPSELPAETTTTPTELPTSASLAPTRK